RVLAREELLQLFLEIGGTTALLRRVQRVHRRPVELSEVGHERSGRHGSLERERLAGERDVLLRGSGSGESLDDMALDTPRHRTDEAFRRRRRVGGADLE